MKRGMGRPVGTVAAFSCLQRWTLFHLIFHHILTTYRGTAYRKPLLSTSPRFFVNKLRGGNWEIVPDFGALWKFLLIFFKKLGLFSPVWGFFPRNKNKILKLQLCLTDKKRSIIIRKINSLNISPIEIKNKLLQMQLYRICVCDCVCVCVCVLSRIRLFATL